MVTTTNHNQWFWHCIGISFQLGPYIPINMHGRRGYQLHNIQPLYTLDNFFYDFYLLGHNAMYWEGTDDSESDVASIFVEVSRIVFFWNIS
jgi:hypothetical protein